MTTALNVALLTGEFVTIGTTEIHRTEDDKIRLTVGSRSYVVDTDIFETLVDNAVSEHVHRMDERSHEVWCDRGLHARADAEAVEGHPTCVGRDLVVTLSGQEYGNYWHQRPDGTTVLFTEWPGLHMTELSVDQVRAAYRIALHFGASPDVEQVTTMLGDALDAYHGGDDWRDQA